MAVTQTLRALGRWDLSLREDTPAYVWDGLQYFGHLVIHMGRQDPRMAGDSLLRSARYVGVLQGKTESGLPKKISGIDVAMWLGDPEQKADIIEEALAVSGDFATVINQVMAGYDAVTVGTIFNQAGSFEQTFQFQSRRQAIDYICQTWGGMAWRVNGDATLDAGLESDIFVVNPEVAVTRKPKNRPGIAGSEVDMFLRSLNGTLETDQDVIDLTTRVVLMAQGSNGQFASATADAPPGYHPYKDLHGNDIKMTRIVQESATDEGNAEARAQLQLNRFLNTRDALNLSTEFHDIKGVAQVGDYIWVWDPVMNLVDNDNEVIFHGQRMNPVKLQMTECTWPVSKGMGVYFRDWSGEWTDLTDYINWESGETTIVVGGYNRSLTDGGSGEFPISQPESNTTVPDVTEWVLPWVQSQYQSPITGQTESEVELRWAKPLNTDASVITDLAYYDIRFRQSNTPLTIFTLSELDSLTDDLTDMNTVGEPIVLGIEQEWQFATAPAEVLKFRLQQLTPGMTYEAQIRAVDNGRPPNLGEWSDIEAWQASRDIFPPATPAAPEVAANPAAVLITHRLGRADGGEFNLDRDLAHLEVHGSTSPLFTPDESTLIGKMPADWGNITGMIPAVASFTVLQQVPMTFKVVSVDQSGNRSNASVGSVATAELWDEKYMRSLTVDKITAGTISAEWIMGSRITTGGIGARVDLSADGIKGYNALNQRLLEWQSSTGKLIVNGAGGIEINDGRLVVRNSNGNIILELGECSDGKHGVQVYKDNSVLVTRIGELSAGSEGIEIINDLGALVRLDTLAFGIQAASVATFQTTASTTFTNLATVGPSVTVTLGNSQRCIVITTATCLSDINGANNFMGFEYTGPGGTNPADEFRALARFSGEFDGIAASKAVLQSPISPAGSWTFTAKYKSGGGTVQFGNRHLIVIPY